MARTLGVVITGGSRGLGFELARAFLLAGDRVVICSRSDASVNNAVWQLRDMVTGAAVWGMACDVTKPGEMSVFSDFAAAKLGYVDRWINNAGSSGARKRPLFDLDDADIMQTVSTNLTGTLIASRSAIKIMLSQAPVPADTAGCHIFNFGFTASGARFSRSPLPHKASKTGVAAVTRFLAEEFRREGIAGIGVHEVSPGLVLTELLLHDTDPPTRQFLETVGESPQTAADLLLPKIRHPKGRYSQLRSRPLPLMLARMAWLQLKCALFAAKGAEA